MNDISLNLLLKFIPEGPLKELVGEQRLDDLITRREFRISDRYLEHEVLARAENDEIFDLRLQFGAGSGTLSGKARKKPLPFTIPFSVSFAPDGVDFNRERKLVHLRITEVKPFDVSWVTAKVVNAVPFLQYDEGRVTWDLTQVPKIADILERRIGGFRIADHVVLREVLLREGELVGRVGVEL